MTDQAAIIQTIAQAAVEAKKAAVQGMAPATGESTSGVRSKPTNRGCKLGRPALKKSTFDWGSMDKYMKLKSLKVIFNIFITYNKNKNQPEIIPII